MVPKSSFTSLWCILYCPIVGVSGTNSVPVLVSVAEMVSTFGPGPQLGDPCITTTHRHEADRNQKVVRDPQSPFESLAILETTRPGLPKTLAPTVHPLGLYSAMTVTINPHNFILLWHNIACIRITSFYQRFPVEMCILPLTFIISSVHFHR